METVKCTECGAKATREDRLLAAIFGHPVLCAVCAERWLSLKCRTCGEPTRLMVNGVPYCVKHIYENSRKEANDG